MCDDYLLYESLLWSGDLDGLRKKSDEIVDFVPLEVCNHEHIKNIEGSDVCTECGMCIEILSRDKEWHFYGSSDTKNSSEPARCHKRRKDQRNIFKILENLNIPEAISANANEKYKVISKDDIYRGDRRRSIIAACLFHAYIEHGEPRTSAKIGKMFKLTEKKVNEGVNTYYKFFPNARVKYLTANDLIKGIMIDVGINMSHFWKINKLCKFLEDKSSTLNRSSPQSLASAIVYLHLCLMPEYKESLGINKIKFSKLVGLSDITISKLARDAALIINSGVKI